MGKRAVNFVWQGVAIGLTALLVYKESEIEQLRSELRAIPTHVPVPSCEVPKVAPPPAATLAAAAPTAVPELSPVSPAPVVSPPAPSKEKEFAVRAKLSNIEKFVPLTEDTRARLTEKFTAEVNDPNAQTESLENIIGQEQANFYRAEVKKAFVKVRDEELDKEVLLLGRNLALSAPQQQRLRDVYVAVEQQIDELYGDPEQRYRFKGTMEERLKRMMETSRYRRDQLAEALKGVLTAEQYEAYLKEEAASAEGELGVWHQ